MNIGHRTRSTNGTPCFTAIETLEARALLSADLGAAAEPLAPVVHAAVQIADSDFLNPQSDAATDASGPETVNDADMYDFGGVWGSPETTVHQNVTIGEVFSDLDAMDGRTEWTRTPADVAATKHGTREESLALRDANEDHDLPADYVGDSGATDAEAASDPILIHTAAPIEPVYSSSVRITWIGDTTSTGIGANIHDVDLGDVALVASYV